MADGALAASYGAAFETAGLPFRIKTPEDAFVAGVKRLAARLVA